MADHQAEEKPEGSAATQSSEAWAMARTQMLFSIEGLAENQCRSCGAYRLDGQPPALHEGWCRR